MDTGLLAVARVTLGLELAQSLGQSSASAAGASPARAGDGSRVARSIDGDVGEGEEHVTLAAGGLSWQIGKRDLSDIET